jgi:hypothetical protein
MAETTALDLNSYSLRFRASTALSPPACASTGRLAHLPGDQVHAAAPRRPNMDAVHRSRCPLCGFHDTVYGDRK